MKRVFLLIVAIAMLSSCTESTQRTLKSIGSNWNGGLYRRVEVYDYNGNKIREYEGKFDVQETPHNYVYFDMQDGRRIIVHGGIIINEEVINKY